MAGETLGSIAEIVMGQSPPGESCNRNGEGAPLLNGPTEFGPHHPTPVQFTTDPRKHSKAGDILFCVRGSTTGRMNWADQDYTIGRGVAAIRHKKGVKYQPFLRALIEYHLSQLLAQATGSTFPNVSYSQLADLPCDVPSDAEQQAIACILGALDGKIELNRRTNETLEAMTRAIFKSWFVDFLPVRAKQRARTQTGDPVRAKAEGHDLDLPPPVAALFPNRFVDSELGKIPAGWEVTSLGDACQVIDCLHSKKPERRDTGLPLLQLNNIRNDGLIDMADTYFIDDADYTRWISRMEASAGDCVITNVGRVGAVAQMPQGLKAALGRNMTGVRCKPEFPFPTFLIECLLSDAMKVEISLNVDTGTILEALNVRNIPRLRFVRANHEVLEHFEQIGRPLRARMEDALTESRTLAALRDALLPKLISGELRVPDAERIVGRCV